MKINIETNLDRELAITITIAHLTDKPYYQVTIQSLYDQEIENPEINIAYSLVPSLADANSIASIYLNLFRDSTVNHVTKSDKDKMNKLQASLQAKPLGRNLIIEINDIGNNKSVTFLHGDGSLITSSDIHLLDELDQCTHTIDGETICLDFSKSNNIEYRIVKQLSEKPLKHGCRPASDTDILSIVNYFLADADYPETEIFNVANAKLELISFAAHQTRPIMSEHKVNEVMALMSNELKSFRAQHGYPEMAADELISEIIENYKSLAIQSHLDYLNNFCQRWDELTANLAQQ